MIRIRQAEILDMATVHDLAHEIWPTAYLEILGQAQLDYMLDKIYSLPSLEHQFHDLKHHFILILDNEIPVGFASFSLHDNDASVYHLNKIYVHHDQQGKKILVKECSIILLRNKKRGCRYASVKCEPPQQSIAFL